uniref:AlNc14C34G3101 protein n=1 Tax=Albugo laibachii Nc14 TaxID=890382 RepID=F0W8H5_9STRA|nr:AlNc14C34G3101 [Albugo laibachii Nc14]|eukprot:CCA17430.1 AlNc14C34G3101 [Albugo laibachii Nc14]
MGARGCTWHMVVILFDHTEVPEKIFLLLFKRKGQLTSAVDIFRFLLSSVKPRRLRGIVRAHLTCDKHFNSSKLFWWLQKRFVGMVRAHLTCDKQIWSLAHLLKLTGSTCVPDINLHFRSICYFFEYYPIKCYRLWQ